MRFIKRGTAVLLAALLTVPTQPVTTAYAWSTGGTEGQNLEGGFWDADPDNRFSTVTNLYTGTASNSERSSKDEVKFNTGNGQVSVVDRETFDQGEGDAFFEEDGSYTINIPESNPFFPYEVQFTGSEGTASKWFMTPDDSVEVDGHTFYVSAYFDGEVVTQMSLDVAGKTVVVYPEAKKFVDEDWAEVESLLPLTEKRMKADFTGFTSMEPDTVDTEGDEVRKDSLLPLTEKRLTANLTGFTPVELTMVELKEVFAGEESLKPEDKIIWTYGTGNDNYTVNAQEDTIDFSYRTGSWQMIVGDDDQLASQNIRYIVNTQTADAQKWLTTTVYSEDSEGNRSPLVPTRGNYYSYTDGNRLNISIPVKDNGTTELIYVGLGMNTAIFENPRYDHFKVYSGEYNDPIKAETEGTDITEQVFPSDMTVSGAGIHYPEDFWVTMISYDKSGKVTGCLPFQLDMRLIQNEISIVLYEEDSRGNQNSVSSTIYQSENDNDYTDYTVTLRNGYAADEKYFLKLSYTRLGIENNDMVTAVYTGLYSSIAEAIEAGTDPILLEKGYESDYSQGVYFTVFVGDDGSNNQEIYKFCVKTMAVQNTLSCSGLYEVDEYGTWHVDSSIYAENKENCEYYTIKLEGGYPADKNYFLTFSYYRFGIENNELVTAAYIGSYSSIKEATESGAEDQKDTLLLGKGYEADYSQGVYFTVFVGDDDSENQEIYKCCVKTEAVSNSLYCYGLFATDINGDIIIDEISNSVSTRIENGCTMRTVTLKYDYPVDSKYYAIFKYCEMGYVSNALVTAAYAGQYSSIKEAEEAEAEKLKYDDNWDSDTWDTWIYEADYSQGVYFTFFVGEDGSEKQEIYKYYIITKKPKDPVLSDSTSIDFIGLRDEKGEAVNCYIVDSYEDSYSDHCYRTILVDNDVDLTRLAPEFSIDVAGINLYASEGNSEPVRQVSGKSIHDFSKGPVQYTTSSESKDSQANYWLQVVQKTEGPGQLYINSLADADSETTIDDTGMVTSTREMLIDGRYDYCHDILLINKGTEDLTNLKAEIDSDEVELDAYWTLNGNYPLSGFDKITREDASGKYVSYGELANMAKLRIVPKENMADGREISGTLTIKSDDRVLAVLNLTGTVGDPSITTTEIPEAVKYVPYGTMIQNSNKYDWNKVSYDLLDGTLPAGVVMKPNGELYGVPTEIGEFSFTVVMENSYEKFADSQKTLTLTVVDNTNDNVDAATDQGYELTRRVNNVALTSSTDQVMVSEGVFSQFVDLYLDGKKLTRDEDYTAESGSTRLTIKSETLKSSDTTGTHTLGIEFRDEDDNLKRAAQNYEVTEEETNPGGNNPGGNNPGGNNPGGSISSGIGGGSNNGNSNNKSSSSTTTAVNEAARKGQVDPEKGIITGEGSGNCHWQQTDGGWQLIYTDGTAAKGSTTQQTNGDAVEQVLWEMVNGSWYAFGVDGYVKSGWVYDYQLNSWYLTSVETGMLSGWYTDPQDKQTYYIDPVTGKLATGWREIDGNWYYFQAESIAPTWELDKETRNWSYNVNSNAKPFGSMYFNERTPDRYFVNIQGIWDGRNPQ